MGLLLTGCQRQLETSLGPEALWVHHQSTGVVTRPAIQLETHMVPPNDRPIGVVMRTAISYHDFGIAKRLTDWYEPTDSSEMSMLKTVLLVPALAGTPVIGSKSTSGYGMRIRIGKGPIAASIEGGFHGSVWSHLSQKTMPFDICIGGWGSTQLSLGNRFGLGLRTTYDVPILHTAMSQSKGIIGGSFVLTISSAPNTNRKKANQAERQVPPALESPEDPPPPAAEEPSSAPATLEEPKDSEATIPLEEAEKGDN